MDRREFLGFTGSAAVGCAMGRKAMAAVGVSYISPLTLGVEGDKAAGFSVAVLFEGKPITAVKTDELSARFQNDDRSLEDVITRWRASSWTGNKTSVGLRGTAYLEATRATVDIEILYDVVTPSAVRKRIRMRQADVYVLFHQVTHRFEPAQPPRKYWSFDQAECRGGALREYFPAAGFRTKDEITVGLLSDTGFRNGWSRMFRRDGKPIKPAPYEIPDPNLYVVASPHDRAQGSEYVQQTFGEELSRLAGEAGTPLTLPAPDKWLRRRSGAVHSLGDVVTITGSAPEDGVFVPFTAEPEKVYSVQFEYRADAELGIGLWDIDERGRQVQDFTRYNDRAPAHNEWQAFESTIFVPAILGKSATLVFSLTEAESKAEIRGLRISRVPAQLRPYHPMEMGKWVEVTSFLFADRGVDDSLRGYRLASQVHLAEALQFKGGETEKVLYADLMMLCWNAGTKTFRPMLAPSIYYSAAGEMYLRDSFFALNGTHNKELNGNVFDLWAENQGDDGAINTLIEPEMANLERKSNDSTPLWLMWALLNRRRFDIAPPADKVKKAAQYCLRAYDPKGTGACTAQFVMGQLDIISYPEGTSIICQNQGLLAVLLRVIRELQIPGISSSIAEDRILHSEELYRSYYDPSLKFVLPMRDMKDAIGLAELFPEYLSLWLFGRKILTDTMVVNHLERIPVLLPRTDCPYPEAGGTVRPIFIGLTDHGKGWQFFTDTWHPMASDSYAKSYVGGEMDGVYYNGGSWMRVEMCSYVVGKLHGWMHWEKAIQNRLWAEINISPDFPTSQEYLATDPKHSFFGYHRVFAWNSFVLTALEMAGIRRPEMDPDYKMS
jgi:hypothetical protein